MPPRKDNNNLHLEVYDNRLRSFDAAVTHTDESKPRRRGTTSASAVASTSKWPHGTTFSVTPETLAHAGFTYEPTPTANDNVTCVYCRRGLEGWEDGDDALDEHLKRADPDTGDRCAWATVMGTKRDYVNAVAASSASQRQAALANLPKPSSDTLQRARHKTFGKWWTYDNKRGWKPTSRALAEAGFYSLPLADAPDTCACTYCDVQLDGWSKNDDPLEEHRSRYPDCYFFTCDAPSPTQKVDNVLTASSKPIQGNTPTEESSVPTVSTSSKSRKSKAPKHAPDTAAAAIADENVAPTEDAESQAEVAPKPKRARTTNATTSKIKAAARASTRRKADTTVATDVDDAGAASVSAMQPEDESVATAAPEVTEDSIAGAAPEAKKPRKGKAKAKASSASTRSKAPIAIEIPDTTSEADNADTAAALPVLDVKKMPEIPSTDVASAAEVPPSSMLDEIAPAKSKARKEPKAKKTKSTAKKVAQESSIAESENTSNVSDFSEAVSQVSAALASVDESSIGHKDEASTPKASQKLAQSRKVSQPIVAASVPSPESIPPTTTASNIIVQTSSMVAVEPEQPLHSKQRTVSQPGKTTVAVVIPSKPAPLPRMQSSLDLLLAQTMPEFSPDKPVRSFVPQIAQSSPQKASQPQPSSAFAKASTLSATEAAMPLHAWVDMLCQREIEQFEAQSAALLAEWQRKSAATRKELEQTLMMTSASAVS